MSKHYTKFELTNPSQCEQAKAKEEKNLYDKENLKTAEVTQEYSAVTVSNYGNRIAGGYSAEAAKIFEGLF